MIFFYKNYLQVFILLISCSLLGNSQQYEVINYKDNKLNIHVKKVEITTMDKRDQIAKLLSVTDSSIILWPNNMAYDYSLIAEHAKIIPISHIRNIKIITDGVFKNILLSTVIGGSLGLIVGSSYPDGWRRVFQIIYSITGSVIGIISSTIVYSVGFFLNQYPIYGDHEAFLFIKKKLQKQTILKTPLTKEEIRGINTIN